uniref:Pyrin domain-containing protein n=1 Tax=Maylandia zebra TaxID=106582 RepID=A0A3P9BT73_9CICH
MTSSVHIPFKLLEMLEDLKKEELEKFKWFLRDRDVLVELQPIPESRLEKASTCDLVDLVVQTYTEKSGEVTKKVFRKINRNDLVQKLSDKVLTTALKINWRILYFLIFNILL